MPRTRDSYHHGDLRRALVDAGLAATRVRGAGALGLRDVTRQVGVSPNAAYRHFTDRHALLAAVAREIQDRMAEQMRARIPTPADVTPRERSRLRLRGAGLGYIAFAVAEPGWFQVAFFGSGGEAEGVLHDAHDRMPPPFALLVEALDDMVETGALSRERRDGAEWACWSAVHGFAELVVQGPLHGRSPDRIDRWAERVVDDIITGIA